MQSTKKSIVIVSTIVVIFAGIGGGIVLKNNNLRVSGQENEETTEVSYEKDSSNVITGSGSTAMGTIDQKFNYKLDSEALLEVEKVYVTTGDEVEEGDSLLKFTSESLNSAIAYYEEKVSDSQYDLEKAKADYNINLEKAKYDYNSNLSTGTTAGLEYDASVKQLQADVDEALDNIKTANKEIETYNYNLDNDTYYYDYKLDNLSNEVTAAQDDLNTKNEELEAAKLTYENKSNDSKESLSNLKTEINTLTENLKSESEVFDNLLSGLYQIDSNTSTKETYITAINSLKVAQSVKSDTDADLSEKKGEIDSINNDINNLKLNYEECQNASNSAVKTLEDANSRYSQAYQKYEQLVNQAKSELNKLSDNEYARNKAYNEAVLNQKTKLITSKEDFEKSMLNCRSASTIYKAAISKIDDSLESARNTADENEAILKWLKSINNGIVTADSSGTIAIVNFKDKDYADGSVGPVSYYDTDKINIEITVPQEQIANIAVGDEAYVSIGSENGRITGEVSSISTEADSNGSVSDVNYTVVISIDNLSGSLSYGSSATVMLKLDDYSDKRIN